MDQVKESKNSQGYLGKCRSNFLGTEFSIFDNGENPDKAKTPDAIRSQHGVVQYETNVLGSKGPRRMKVLLPNVDLQGNQALWKSADVSANSKIGKIHLKIHLTNFNGFCVFSKLIGMFLLFTLLFSLHNPSRNSSRLITRRRLCSFLTSHPSGTSVSTLNFEYSLQSECDVLNLNLNCEQRSRHLF